MTAEGERQITNFVPILFSAAEFELFAQNFLQPPEKCRFFVRFTRKEWGMAWASFGGFSYFSSFAVLDKRTKVRYNIFSSLTDCEQLALIH